MSTAGDPTPKRMPPLNAPDLLRTLHRHGVDFVVIGGFSLAAHSVARATKDLDIVPEPSRANLQRLLAALEELDAAPGALDDFDPDEILELSLENLELGGNWILRTRFGRLDVMQYVEGVRSYRKPARGSGPTKDRRDRRADTLRRSRRPHRNEDGRRSRPGPDRHRHPRAIAGGVKEPI